MIFPTHVTVGDFRRVTEGMPDAAPLCMEYREVCNDHIFARVDRLGIGVPRDYSEPGSEPLAGPVLTISLIEADEDDDDDEYNDDTDLDADELSITSLRHGDEVFWNDPDDGKCSRYITIGTIEVAGDVVKITGKDGSYLECLASELS